MKLVSMKREAADYGMECPGVSRFGYGLMINLDEAQCEALGLSKALRPGTQVSVKAIGIVTSATERLERDGDDVGTDISLSIQLTDLGMEPQGKLSDAAAILYGADV